MFENKEKIRLMKGRYTLRKETNTFEFVSETTSVFAVDFDVQTLFALATEMYDDGFDVLCEKFDTETGYGTAHLFCL